MGRRGESVVEVGDRKFEGWTCWEGWGLVTTSHELLRSLEIGELAFTAIDGKKLSLLVGTRWDLCFPHMKIKQQRLAPFTGAGSFYWHKVHQPNMAQIGPFAECSKITLHIFCPEFQPY